MDTSITGGSRRSTGTESVITDGQFVLVQRGEQDKIIEFKADGKLRFGRGNGQQEIELKNAEGLPFFSSFRVQSYNSESGTTKKKTFYLEPITDAIMPPEELFVAVAEKTSSGKDNRNIMDDNKSQPMGQTDIAVLREKGISGPEILDTLISNSKTFTQKTEFSQEKYLKKKVRAYGDSLLFVKPTLKVIADYNFRVDPVKIMNLRADSLAQLLTYSNICSGGRYMVYETGCSSLVVAAVLERLGGNGLCLHIHAGSTPQRQALHCLNFTSDQLKPLQTLDVYYIIRHSRSGGAEEVESEESGTEPAIKKTKLMDGSVDLLEDEQQDESTLQPTLRKSVNRLDNEKSASIFESTEFDGLIICAKEHPLSILQNLLPRLRASSPFAVFCQYPEPLGECFTWLKDGNKGVNLNIFDNWYRNMQIQPERTHPEINMSSNGGYILTGIYVLK